MKLTNTTLLALCLLALLASPALSQKSGGKGKKTESVPDTEEPAAEGPVAPPKVVKGPVKPKVVKIAAVKPKKVIKAPVKPKTTKKAPVKPKKAKKAGPKKCKGDATYTISTNCVWTRKTHPVDYPKNAHLSPLCGTVHSKNYFLWRKDDQARNGAKEIAETGMCSAAMDEIKNCQNQVPPACQEAFSFSCSRKSGICKHGGDVTATPEHTLLSFQSMIAPSPDWSIGVDALQLCVEGEWLKKYSANLFAIDMGTDDGATFKAEDQPNGLRRPITPFDPKDPKSIFYNKKAKKTFPICKVTITLKK